MRHSADMNHFVSLSTMQTGVAKRACGASEGMKHNSAEMRETANSVHCERTIGERFWKNHIGKAIFPLQVLLIKKSSSTGK